MTGGYWFPRQCQSTAFVSAFDQLGEGVTGNHIYLYSRYNGRLERMDPSVRDIPLGVPDGVYGAPHISGASNFARGLNLFRYRIFHPQLPQFTDLDTGDVASAEVSDGGGKLFSKPTVTSWVS
ncbi:MAG: hypothetical protein ACI91F_003179 [Candidatus Binatia bacterium]